MLELTDSLKVGLQETAEHLQGHERRRFMAQTVAELGRGGAAPRRARIRLAPRPAWQRATRKRKRYGLYGCV